DAAPARGAGGWAGVRRGVADRRVPVVAPRPRVLGLGVVLRVLGFGYLIAGRRGPILALLVVTTLLAWTPWSAVTAPPLGAGLAVADGFRLPRWQLLALGMVLFVGAGPSCCP